MPSFTAAEAAVVGDTDLLRNKSYAISSIDRIIEDVGIFVATLAQVDKFVMKVGQNVVMELDAMHGTAIDASKLADVEIDVPAGERITAVVTVDTATTVCQLVINIEDLE